MGSAIKSQEFTLQRVGETNTISSDLKWLPTLTNKCIGRQHRIPDQELIEKMKHEKTLLKESATLNKGTGSENSMLSVSPVIGTNFLGNVNNGNSPLDNSIAISDGGWIVSVANTTIEFYNTSGVNTYYNTIPNFFNDNTITNTYDPFVIYDSGADRFIFFAQECSGNSANSFLLICFSKTNNPNDGWWTYKLTGNPLNNNTWFDYPKLAVSTNELYIAGICFQMAPAERLIKPFFIKLKSQMVMPEGLLTGNIGQALREIHLLCFRFPADMHRITAQDVIWFQQQPVVRPPSTFMI